MLSSYNETCAALTGLDADGILGIDNSSLLCGSERLRVAVETELGSKNVPVAVSGSEEMDGVETVRDERVRRLGDIGDTRDNVEARIELSDETERETVNGTVSDSVAMDKRVLGSMLNEGVSRGVDSSGKLGIVLIRDGGRLVDTMLSSSS